LGKREEEEGIEGRRVKREKKKGKRRNPGPKIIKKVRAMRTGRARLCVLPV